MKMLIDGNSEAHRHFAKLSHLKTKDGLLTGMAFGCIRSLSKMMKDFNIPNKNDIYYIWDSGISNRNEIDTNYKSNRVNSGDNFNDFLKSKKILIEFLIRSKIPQIVYSGYEADDIINTISLLGDCIIITVDDDLLQCVNDKNNVKVYNTRAKILYDEKKVIEKYKTTPDNLKTIWAREGDLSDNIKKSNTQEEYDKNLKLLTLQKINNLEVKNNLFQEFNESDEEFLIKLESKTLNSAFENFKK